MDVRAIVPQVRDRYMPSGSNASAVDEGGKVRESGGKLSLLIRFCLGVGVVECVGWE